MNEPTNNNAAVLSIEMEWLRQLIDLRLRLFFDDNPPYPSLRELPAPDHKQPGAYTETLIKYNLQLPERIILALALANRLKPELLDGFLTKNATYDKRFSEFQLTNGFISNTSPKMHTAVTLIGQKTGLNAKDIGLPFVKGIAGLTERAESIVAEIDQQTISSKKRKDDKNTLSKVTGMARDEAFILPGADPQKFYEAGHLVGDQLLKNKGDKYSFQLKNLAPQTSKFNSPAYENIMEETIKDEASKGKRIKVTVNLTYPGKSYNVSLQTLVDKGIIEKSADNNNGTIDIKGGNKNLNPAEESAFSRRIPKQWKITAEE